MCHTFVESKVERDPYCRRILMARVEEGLLHRARVHENVEDFPLKVTPPLRAAQGGGGSLARYPGIMSGIVKTRNSQSDEA